MAANPSEEIAAVSVMQFRHKADEETIMLFSRKLGEALRGEAQGVALIDIRGPEDFRFYVTGRAKILRACTRGALLDLLDRLKEEQNQ